MDIDAFLCHLGTDASVLPEAPAGDAGQLIQHRREDKVHPCLLCGSPAAAAFLVTADGDVPRWLDLCMNDAKHLYDWAADNPADELVFPKSRSTSELGQVRLPLCGYPVPELAQLLVGLEDALACPAVHRPDRLHILLREQRIPQGRAVQPLVR
ncbi:hypothetical protein [Amycolatopsis dendrobii]|uniref:Uncharacterized protein n=1 Tax=Amycolatopsis dendrobii TaxID=2760662 RepID=A0A7W3VUQ5_9PSEU|nr:hypothetical protein [Amycolatopsis dendrobii]MBB1153500.1 hypothetical protein [Amycolatopsis dendrobii]